MYTMSRHSAAVDPCDSHTTLSFWNDVQQRFKSEHGMDASLQMVLTTHRVRIIKKERRIGKVSLLQNVYVCTSTMIMQVGTLRWQKSFQVFRL